MQEFHRRKSGKDADLLPVAVGMSIAFEKLISIVMTDEVIFCKYIFDQLPPARYGVLVLATERCGCSDLCCWDLFTAQGTN